MRIPRHVRTDAGTAVLLVALYRASVVANAENMALYDARLRQRARTEPSR
jgi:hypothetical protein